MSHLAYTFLNINFPSSDFYCVVFCCCRQLHRWVVLYWTLCGRCVTTLTSTYDAYKCFRQFIDNKVGGIYLCLFTALQCSIHVWLLNWKCVCCRMVRRGVLFAVCSVFLSMPSQNLLVDLNEQLFETRTWLAGKQKTLPGTKVSLQTLTYSTSIEISLIVIGLLFYTCGFNSKIPHE